MTKCLFAAAVSLLAAAAFAAVDVNQANQAELEVVKGIGPGLSTAILDERSKGAFKDWADFVRRVGGVGAGSAARLSAAGLTVDGASFKAPAPVAPGATK